MEHWSFHKILCKETPTYKAKQEVVAAKKTLEEQEVALGVDHHETLRTSNNIGRLLREQGKLKEAEPFYRRALERCEQTMRSAQEPSLAINVFLVASR